MATIRTNVEFGQEYVDINSGFRGICVCIAQWQFGCVRVTLQPTMDRDGKLPRTETFDEGSLKGIKSVVNRSGGPSPITPNYPSPQCR